MLNNYPATMDTTKFDNKMAELRAEEIAKASSSKPAGRPKGPEKVMFRKRVTKEELKKLEDAFDKVVPASIGADPTGGPSLATQNEVNELKAQIKALLEDNDRLSKEVATVEHRLSRVARLTDNEKLILWIRKYDELKKVYDLRVGGSEFSQ